MLRSTILTRALAGALLALLAATTGARATPPPLTAYGELPRIEEAAISPGGAQIAVIATIKGTRELLFLDSSRKLLRSAAVGDLKLRSLQWIGDDAVLLIYSETRKLGAEFVAHQFEAYRAMIVPVDPGKDISIVFADDHRLVPSVFGNYGVRQIGGEWFGYFSGLAYDTGTNGRRFLPSTTPALYQVRLSDNTARRVAFPPPDSTWRDWLVDAGGKVAATFDVDQKSGAWTLAGANGRVIASGTQPAGQAALVAFGKDGTGAIFSVEAPDDGTTRWYEVPLDGSRQPAEILFGENIDRIYADPVDGRMIGYLRRNTQGGRVFFDPEHQAIADKLAHAFRNLRLTIADWTPDFGQLLVRTSGNGDSGTWYTVDAAKLHADEFGVERPAIPSEAVGPVSDFAYKASDGLDLDGVLTLPPGREAKNLPVIVFPHGGPADYDVVEFDWWAQAFASRGYAVFQPNFRGSTNRDDAFQHAGDGQWGRKMQTDISDGLATLAKQGIVDPARACIMGGSYGGYVALAGVTLQHGLYRCAVSVAGIADLPLMYRTDYDQSGQSTVVARSLRAELGSQSGLDDVSPRRFAGQADAPILLVHGRDDTVVPFEQSEKMADALKDAHKPYELVDLGSADHWLSRSETREKMLEAAMTFIEKYDPPGRAAGSQSDEGATAAQ